MKIIKEGSLKQPITFNCTKCGCQFIAEGDEYIIQESMFSDNKFAFVNCPYCGYVVTEDLD